MKIKNFKETIEVSEGIELAVEGSKITIKGSNGELSKTLNMPRFVFAKDEKGLNVSCDGFHIYDKRNLNTIKAHIKNMEKGVTEGFTYTLKICSGHFPMNVAINGNKFVVKNLFGEKVPRELILKSGADVKIDGDIINVTGKDIEIVSQIAADIEQLTRITDRDRRIFQDGIYITNKAGKAIN